MTARGAIVTGGSAGIGLEIARRLARRDHFVTICARDPEKLHTAAATIAAEGGPGVETVAGNLAKPELAHVLVAHHREVHGRLDVLVNNAGVGIGRGVEDISDREIDLQYGVNLRPVIQLYREAVPLLREAAVEHHNAMVINNASIGGKRPEAIVSVYSALKAAIIAFTASMNRELGADGIKSTALCPAFVDTDLTAWTRDSIPQDEMLSVDDVADAVDWLLTTSPRCVVPELVLSRPGDTL